MKALDIMRPVTVSVKPDETVHAAIRIMRGHTSRECDFMADLPVIDGEGSPHGVLTVGSILRSMIPAYLRDTTLGDFAWDGMLEKAAALSSKTVGEVLGVTEQAVLDGPSSLMECNGLMARTGSRSVVVTDSDGRAAGIVTEYDIFSSLFIGVDHDEGNR